jgi:hypothetical protein
MQYASRSATPRYSSASILMSVSPSPRLALRELGFRTVVVEDATYSSHELQHQRGLARMTDAGVERNYCKGLLALEWLQTVDPARKVLGAAAKFGTPAVGL